MNGAVVQQQSIDSRVDAFDWAAIDEALNSKGYATTPVLFSADEARTLAAQYEQADIFRSRVVMGQHGFGRGEYKYFAYPLPDVIAQLRTCFYPRLVSTANAWNQAMGLEPRYPNSLAEMLDRCHAAGQTLQLPAPRSLR
jgi:uncharacterized protein